MGQDKQANVGSALLTTYPVLQALQDPFDAEELAEQEMQFDGQAMQLDPDRKKPAKQAEQVVAPLSFSVQVLQLLPQVKQAKDSAPRVIPSLVVHSSQTTVV